MDMDKKAIGKNEMIWVGVQTDETTPATLTSSGTIFLTSEAKFDQELVKAENKEKRNTLAKQKGETAGYKVGTFSFSTNMKLSGTAGVAPPISPLLTALFGTETVNAGTDVRYSHYLIDDEIVYLTVLYKRDFETMLITGLAINKGSLKTVATELQAIDWSGFFAKKVHTGMDELDSAIDGTVTPVTEIPLAHYDEDYNIFDVGARIVVGDDDGGGTGLEITAVDPADNKVTVSGGVTTAQDAGVIVKGWTPAAAEAGYNVVGQFGWLLDSRTGSLSNVKITESSVEIDNGFKAVENEKADTLFPGRVSKGADRSATFSMQKYFSLRDLDVMKKIENNQAYEVAVNIGNAAGKIATLSIPAFTPEKNDVSGDEEKTASISGTCYEGTGSDEVTLILT